MTVHTLAADIASRVKDMAADNVENNTTLLEKLIGDYVRGVIETVDLLEDRRKQKANQ